MRIDVVMPQLGESVIEGVVAKWLVKAGDAVAKDQPLVEISSDKVDAEIPSPAAGVVVEILAKEGDTVPVLAPIARIETEKTAAAPPPEAAPPKAPWDEETEGFPGAMARRTGPPLPAPPRVEPVAPPSPPEPSPEGPRIRVTPVVARMALEHSLDLSKIPGTGIDGRVSKRDVEDFLARGKTAAAAPAAPPRPPPAAAPSPPPPVPPPRPVGDLSAEAATAAKEDQVIPFTPIRKRIAEHMVMSKRTSPHVHTFAEVDMREVAAYREAKKREGISLTYLPFVLLATVRAIREFPMMNATVVGESTVIKKAINIGVAVDTSRGLIVPVIRDADKMTLREISGAVEDFASRAATHRIMPDELAGGTFTISNPGPKGNLFGTPILNQPQVGILRMGQVVKRPVVAKLDGEDAIVIRPMMYLGLGYDHRVVDGVAGNGFLFRIREILEGWEFSE
ncbi:MAG: dihydrolipoamide acetyltransferase family protein [Deltaproteobacteria bacterium]|nr:dihydrolipoamide acetyltransferase family protein [Deltaproteobacteria bacterium]